MNELRIKLTHGFEVPWGELEYDWVAMDGCGNWWEYSLEPVFHHKQKAWDIPNAVNILEYRCRHFKCLKLDEPPENTLMQRPKNARRYHQRDGIEPREQRKQSSNSRDRVYSVSRSFVSVGQTCPQIQLGCYG